MRETGSEPKRYVPDWQSPIRRSPIAPTETEITGFRSPDINSKKDRA